MDEFLRLSIALFAGVLIGTGAAVVSNKFFAPDFNGANGVVRRLNRLEWVVTALVAVQVMALVIGLMSRYLDIRELREGQAEIKKALRR